MITEIDYCPLDGSKPEEAFFGPSDMRDLCRIWLESLQKPPMDGTRQGQSTAMVPVLESFVLFEGLDGK